MYVLLNDCYHSTDKGLHCTKMKKEILNCIEKYRVLRTVLFVKTGILNQMYISVVYMYMGRLFCMPHANFMG